MATAVKPSSSTYVFYNCCKYGMSLTGPDTKLMFNSGETERRWGRAASVIKVIFPSPYTGEFSNYNGIKILADGMEKYSSEGQGDGFFYIKFQADGSFQVERERKHVCVPLPKLTREEMVARYQKGEKFYMSDVNHEDFVWFLDQPIDPPSPNTRRRHAPFA